MRWTSCTAAITHAGRIPAAEVSGYWPVSLAHGQVGLRPIRYGDARAWSQVRERNADWLRRWDSSQPPHQPPNAREQPTSYRRMVGKLRAQARQGQSLPWVITYAETMPGARRLVGQLTVAGIQLGSARWAHLGYWLDRAVAGRGIAPLAVAMACDYCWDELGLHRIEVAIRPENTNSLRVVAKLGFRYEGRRPDFLHIDGQWRDHEIFALNAEEVSGGSGGSGGLVQRYLTSRDGSESRR